MRCSANTEKFAGWFLAGLTTVAVDGSQSKVTIATTPWFSSCTADQGDALSPYADSLFQGWERDFTLVQWDQRGAGRTYGKTGPAIEPTMTVERMAQDGVEVAEFLTIHLHKKEDHH
jgi:hypothetical protein